jgi:protein PsiE
MRGISRIGHKAIAWVEDVGLIIIAISAVIAVGIEIPTMIEARTVSLAELLLLFIYLEVLAMVARYLDSGKLPVRMPLYIAIVALGRYMTLDMRSLDAWRMPGVAGAASLISLAILVIRYAILDSLAARRMTANKPPEATRIVSSVCGLTRT